MKINPQYLAVIETRRAARAPPQRNAMTLKPMKQDQYAEGKGAMSRVVLVPIAITLVATLVPHRKQRYDTVGDWQWKGSVVEIKVSQEIADRRPDYATLVFVHEIVEALLCHKDGISTEQVDRFDKAYLREGEPGDDPNAPYHREHRIAEQVERVLASELGIKWSDYQQALDEIPERIEQDKRSRK